MMPLLLIQVAKVHIQAILTSGKFPKPVAATDEARNNLYSQGDMGIAACHNWDLLQQLNKVPGSPEMQKT